MVVAGRLEHVDEAVHHGHLIAGDDEGACRSAHAIWRRTEALTLAFGNESVGHGEDHQRDVALRRGRDDLVQGLDEFGLRPVQSRRKTERHAKVAAADETGVDTFDREDLLCVGSA